MLVIEQVLIADLETFNVSAIKGRKDLNVSIYPVSLNYIYTSEADPSLTLCLWMHFNQCKTHKNTAFPN